MGTHPIFESDFDCLTERKSRTELSSPPQDVSLKLPSDHSPSLLPTAISIPPPNSLVPVLPPLVLLDPVPVSEQFSAPSSLVTPETHPSRVNFSHMPFWDSPSLKPWVFSAWWLLS